MEVNNKVLATTRIKIVGEWDKPTGKVDFSEDDDDKAEQPPKSSK